MKCCMGYWCTSIAHSCLFLCCVCMWPASDGLNQLNSFKSYQRTGMLVYHLRESIVAGIYSFIELARAMYFSRCQVQYFRVYKNIYKNAYIYKHIQWMYPWNALYAYCSNVSHGRPMMAWNGLRNMLIQSLSQYMQRSKDEFPFYHSTLLFPSSVIQAA